jgi:hypothetical protein
MPTKVKDAEIVALAEAMLGELEALRQRGGESYPPRLRQLAELAAGSPTDEQAQKAAAKKAFTARAVVTEKVNKKPSLDAPVYFKEDAPKPDPAGDLARRMLAVLRAQKRLGPDAYPPTLRRLAELCGLNASDTRVTKAAGHKAMTDQAFVAAKAKGKPNLDAPVVLSEDVDGDIAAVLAALLRFGLSATTSGGKKPAASTAFTPAEVKGRLVRELQAPVLAAIQRGVDRGVLPEGVAWVVTKGKPYLFLMENMRPAARVARPAVEVPPAPEPEAVGAAATPVRPARDFAGAFREAFEQLDRRNGATNFVKLADLRRALAGFGRDEFDSGLRALRLGGEFSLDSHEGLHGSLTPEEREAGVREAGSLLVYVSRR